MDLQMASTSKDTIPVVDVDDIELVDYDVISQPSPKRRKIEIDEKKLGRCSKWMSANDLIPFLQPGDLVEINRDLFQHWVVFTHILYDHAYCVHLSGLDDDINFASTALVDSGFASVRGSVQTKGLSRSFSTGSFGDLFKTSIRDCDIAQVRRDKLCSVACDSMCRINNGKDTMFEAYSNSTIVERAFNQLGVQKYNLMLTNCEHFATWCRYGSKSSSQTTLVKTMATAVVTGVITGGCGVSMTCAALTTLAACKAGNILRNKLSKRLSLDWH